MPDEAEMVLSILGPFEIHEDVTMDATMLCCTTCRWRDEAPVALIGIIRKAFDHSKSSAHNG